MRAVRFITVYAYVLILAGCMAIDPWGTKTYVSASSSSIFVSSTPDTVSAKPRARTEPEIVGRKLTLAECIRIALERNPKTKNSWQSSQSAAASVGQAKAAYLPSTDFTAGARRDDSVLLSKQSTGPVNTFDAGFGVRYLLFDGGLRFSRLEGAKADLLSANFQHNTTLQEVALAVEETYYKLLSTKQFISVVGQTVKQTQYHLDVARARYKAGIVTKSDVLRAETEKANADLVMVRARSAVRIAHGQLASVMGLKVSEKFDVVDLLQDLHQQEMGEIDQLLDEAASKRPELRAALAQIEYRRAGVKAAHAKYWPKMTVDAGYGWRDRTFIPDQEEWAVGVGVTMPLFDGFNRDYAVQRAKSDLAGAVADHENLLQDIELEVWTSYSLLVEAGQAIDAAQTLVASAEESARLSEGKYKNGTDSIIELIDAQTARSMASFQLVQARFDWYTALARVERALGRTLAGSIVHADREDHQ